MRGRRSKYSSNDFSVAGALLAGGSEALMSSRLSWSIDAGVYSREAIFASCRRWSASASFKIVRSGKTRWKIAVRAKAGAAPARLREIREGFEDEVMHQELRAAALRDSGGVREAIVLRALVSASGEGA